MGFKDESGGGKEEEILAYTSGCRVLPVIETGTSKRGPIFGKEEKMGRNISLTLDMLSMRYL